MSRFVFIDVDGVLNNTACFRYNWGIRVAADPRCVAALNRVVKETGAELVLSSAWRREGLKFCREKFRQWGVEAPLIGRTTISMPNAPRGLEIADWLDKHAPQANFVILDDTDDMAHLKHRLIQTDFDRGLTQADARRAIRLLDGAGKISDEEAA